MLSITASSIEFETIRLLRFSLNAMIGVLGLSKLTLVNSRFEYSIPHSSRIVETNALRIGYG